MSDLIEHLKNKLKEHPIKRIIFPEVTDERILHAAIRLKKEKLLEPVFIGNRGDLDQEWGFQYSDLRTSSIIDIATYKNMDTMIKTFIQLRNGKVDQTTAAECMNNPNYFATMLVYFGEVDGLVGGAVRSTIDTVKPPFEIIKTVSGVQKASGIFLLTRGEEKYLFADCAINIAPSSEDLAEIALTSAKTAELFNIDPHIAMLSFSTKGSAISEETKRVQKAVELVKAKEASLPIDGELQFDAAFVPEVGQFKAGQSKVAGKANIFIFPSLEAGNIGYKIAERLGGFEAVGSILQGLTKPVNDLSRGCREEDVYKLAIITASQANRLP